MTAWSVPFINQWLPHARWLNRSSVGRLGPAPFAFIVFSVIGVSVADSMYVQPFPVSYAIALFSAACAPPVFVATFFRLELSGQIDQLRMSGVGAGALLAVLCLGLVLPPIFLGGVFAAAGIVADRVQGNQVVFLLLAFGFAAAVSICALSIASTVHWVAQVLLGIAIIAGAAILSIASATFDGITFGGIAWFEWVTRRGVWPVVALGELVVFIACVPRLVNVVRRPAAGRYAAQPPTRVWSEVPFDAIPHLARGLVQSQMPALATLALAILAILGIVFLGSGSHDDKVVGASLAAYAPLVFGALNLFHHSRLDSATGRLHLVRSAPIATLPAVLLIVGGIYLPYILATITAAGVASAVLRAPLMWPLVAAMFVGMSAPAVAAEAWLIPSKRHLVNLVMASPFVFIVWSANQPLADQLILCTVVGWFPWIAAAATLRNPARPRIGPVLMTLAIAGIVAVAVARSYIVCFIVTQGLLFSTAWMDRSWSAANRYLPVAAILGVGTVSITLNSVPWPIGLASIAMMGLGWLIGGHLDRRWPRADHAMIVKGVISYGMLIAIGLGQSLAALPFKAVITRTALVAMSLMLVVTVGAELVRRLSKGRLDS